ncbi:hypothetical protein O181_056457 [Austropuccinia psidii MF-1]|uniref:CCHC-type domain-containing protein n=1 Tax=Austropuccinia psidii MF-1 TaxID=1389203 RepID=A0A9Q3EAU3_9BASI|nr:hypothetical protein [Austropuccinia psidii MF-1]
MKPQPQSHVMDNPYHQDDIKPDAMLMNNSRSPSRYQDGDNMSYSEKEDLKHLPEAVELKDKFRERVAEVAKKKNSCHNCGSTDHYANNCPKAKKEVYAIEKVPEEESPTENSDPDSMVDAIREQSDEEKDPREEFLVEYQEET